MTASSRFALFDFLGRAKVFYLVEEENLTATTTTAVRNPGHFHFVCDASGSMYSQMAGVRSLLVKLVTLEEYRDAEVFVSVHSFSSTGDLVTHAARVKISDFMAPDSKALAEVQRLSPRGLTCMSQGLKAVPSLVRDGELTAVVLLSDGFANDYSPGAERREIDGIVETLRKMKNVFVNTISLGAWADFPLLSYIANACSGTCFQAPTAREVYDVIHSTVTLIAGSTSPAIDVPMSGASYAVFMSRSGGKVMGSASNFLVRGLRAEDDKVVYRYRRVEEAEYLASSAPVCGDKGASVAPILAFAKAQLSEGYVNRAKYALVATRDETMLLAHARALVGTEIAAMSADVENAALNGIPAGHVVTTSYGLPNASVLSVLGVLSILTEYATDIEVDMNAFTQGYKKRGIKRLTGTRLPDGTVQPIDVKLVPRAPSQFRRLSSVDINRNNATANMLVTEPSNLVRIADGSVISDVEGIKLDLWSPRNYTLVGDGVLNVARLFVRISNKRLFRALVSAGVLPSVDFDAKATYEIVLEGRPLIAYDATFSPDMLDGVFDRVARMKVLASILSASMKGQSDAYTADQLAALKKVYVTGSMNFSPPTTNEYADLNAALADGIIDTRLSYKVDIGSRDILNLGELYSANAYLARRFTVAVNGTVEPKPKFEMRWDAGVKYGIKPVGPKLTVGPVDDLMYPIFVDFLGIASNGSVAAILKDAGVDADTSAAFLAAVQGGKSKDDAVELFTDVRKAVEAAIERTFRDAVSPMVFYVGATGLVPDEFNARAMTAEQAKEKYKNLSIGKDEADGTFYDVNGTILCVYVKAEYFSTGKVAPAVADEDAA
jgi:hypothetical protein